VLVWLCGFELRELWFDACFDSGFGVAWFGCLAGVGWAWRGWPGVWCCGVGGAVAGGIAAAGVVVVGFCGGGRCVVWARCCCCDP